MARTLAELEAELAQFVAELERFKKVVANALSIDARTDEQVAADDEATANEQKAIDIQARADTAAAAKAS